MVRKYPRINGLSRFQVGLAWGWFLYLVTTVCFVIVGSFLDGNNITSIPLVIGGVLFTVLVSFVILLGFMFLVALTIMAGDAIRNHLDVLRKRGKL